MKIISVFSLATEFKKGFTKYEEKIFQKKNTGGFPRKNDETTQLPFHLDDSCKNFISNG